MGKPGFEFIEMPVRTRAEKPREIGINFHGDWGKSLREVEDLCEALGEWLDVVKLAVLTGRLMDRDLTKRKIEVYTEHQIRVFPGGMTLEAALICNKVPEFFDEAEDLGCTVVEVSESEVKMDPRTKIKLVEMAVERGFRVIAEMGPHHPEEPFSVADTIKRARRFLEAGAWKICIEGEVNGMMKPWEDAAGADRMLSLINGIGPEETIVELGGGWPFIEWMILNFGSDVNFGNVRADMIMPIEHVRRGLNRSTWFGKFHSL